MTPISPRGLPYPDYLVHDQGSVVAFEPLSEAAREALRTLPWRLVGEQAWRAGALVVTRKGVEAVKAALVGLKGEEWDERE